MDRHASVLLLNVTPFRTLFRTTVNVSRLFLVAAKYLFLRNYNCSIINRLSSSRNYSLKKRIVQCGLTLMQIFQRNSQKL